MSAQSKDRDVYTSKVDRQCNRIFTHGKIVGYTTYMALKSAQELEKSSMARKTAASKQKKAKINKVREIRSRLGMFQNDLAQDADVSVASIRGTEGFTRELSGPLKSRIVFALSKKSEQRGEGKLAFTDVFPD